MTGDEKKPLTLSEYFKRFRSNIEPPEHRAAKAQEIPGDVREYLENHEDFGTRYPHSRLTGSYKRHTAVHNIKDVDFLAFVSEENGKPEPADVLKELCTTLDGLPEALGYGGRAQTLRGQRRSVNVEFDDEDFHLDVVPALIPDGIDGVLLVPDREWGEWVESHPLGYGKALSALNVANGEKVVPLVKMVKHWRTHQMKRNRPKSYWLECLVYRHVDKGVTTANTSYAELFTDFLRSVREEFRKWLDEDGVPEIPDPMLGNNVAFNWERIAFESFMRRLDESIGWAERALAKDQDQLDEAIELWQKVFGEEYFTDSLDLRKLQKADWLGAAGGGWVGSSGGVSVDRPKNESGVKPPNHRFYGDEG